MSNIEWELVTKKRWGNNKYSITDVISFVGMTFALFVAYKSFNGVNALSWFNVNVELQKIGIIAILLFFANMLSALNVLEDTINTLFRTVVVPVVLIYAVGGDFNNAKQHVRGINFGNSNVSVGNNYAQLPQNLNTKPVIVSTQDHSDATKWNRIGIEQSLRRLRALKAGDERDWCDTVDANRSNQGRLHCNTGFKWSKNSWSTRNDTF